MGTRIEIEPGYEAALAAAGLRTFDDFLNAKAGAPVSKHRHRETVPIEFAVDGVNRKFFLKRVFRVPPAHVIGPLIGLSKPISQPAHEWRICDAMKKSGLPAMDRIAMGERRSFGMPTQAFILVAASPYRHTLEEWLTPGFDKPRAFSAEERIDLLRAVAMLGKRICDGSFKWPDADAKHIFAKLVNVAGKSSWEFCLIDLERVAYKTNPEEPCIVIIRQILRSMNPLRLSEMEVLAISEAIGTNLKEFKWDIEAEMYLGNGSMLEDGLRLVDHYIHPRRKHLRKRNDVYLNSSFEISLQRFGIDSLNSVFALRSGQLMTKPGLATHRDRIRLELDFGEHGRRPGYLKRFRKPPVKEQLSRIWNGGFKRSNARLESKNARRLSEAGIGTFDTLAWGQEMRAGVEFRSFLITDEVPGESLEKAVEHIGSQGLTLPATDKFEIIRQLAMITRRMHCEGLFHRDLYLCHVFLARNSDGRHVLSVIDLGRMITRNMMCSRWVVKDLAALDYSSPNSIVTRADRARFLYYYLSGSEKRSRLTEQLRMQFPSFANAVARRNRKTAAHDAKRAARHKRSQTAT